MAKRPSKAKGEDAELLHTEPSSAEGKTVPGLTATASAFVPLARDLARWAGAEKLHPYLVLFLARVASDYSIPDQDAQYLFNIRNENIPKGVLAQWPEPFVSNLRSQIQAFIRHIGDHKDSDTSSIEESLSIRTERALRLLKSYLVEPPRPKLVTLGDILRRHRMAAGLTQDQLAQVSGVSQAQISQLEKDRWLPRVDALMALAKALGVPAAALLPPDDTPP